MSFYEYIFHEFEHLDFFPSEKISFHRDIIAYVTNSQWGRENFIADILKLFSHQSLSRNHVLEMHDRGVGCTSKVGKQYIYRKSTTENWYVIFYIISPTLSGWAIANHAHPVHTPL